MNIKKFIFAIIFFSFFVYGKILPLNGYRYDYLVDFVGGKVICGVDSFNFNSKVDTGYFFVWQGMLYNFNHGMLYLDGESIEKFDNVVLPDIDFLACSLQFFVRDKFLFLPVNCGFVVYNLDTKRVDGTIICTFDRGETDILFPEIFLNKDYCFLVFYKRVEVYYKFKRVKVIRVDNALFFRFSAGKDFFSILSVEKPGGIFSIKTVLRSYDYKFNLLNSIELDVFPKNIFGINGDFIFEKKDISVFSLFGSKKVHIVKTDLKKGVVKKYSFSVSNKRRHLFPVYAGKKLYVVAQCKDGRVYLLDVYRDKKERLKKSVYYDYTFLKGKKGGVFYEKNGDNYFPVRFKLSLISRLF